MHVHMHTHARAHTRAHTRAHVTAPVAHMPIDLSKPKLCHMMTHIKGVSNVVAATSPFNGCILRSPLHSAINLPNDPSLSTVTAFLAGVFLRAFYLSDAKLDYICNVGLTVNVIV